MLERVEEFKALRPDITTIYIGWNDLYSYDAQSSDHWHLYSRWLLRRAYERAYEHLFAQRAALAAYQKPKHADLSDPELNRLEGYVPGFVEDVRRVAEEMKAGGSSVVLLTLPSLFTTTEKPSARALQIGHLPIFTNNSYVLAKMAERYNEALRSVARQEGLQLIDLEKWSGTRLEPRDAYFLDSVHLNEEGADLLGNYLSTQLASFVPANSTQARQAASKFSQ